MLDMSNTYRLIIQTADRESEMVKWERDTFLFKHPPYTTCQGTILIILAGAQQLNVKFRYFPTNRKKQRFDRRIFENISISTLNYTRYLNR